MLLFLFASAINTFFNWDEKVAGGTSILCHWFAYLQSWGGISKVVAYGIDQVPILLGIGVFVQLLGALSLLFMIQPRAGAICVLIFLIPVTFIARPFWFGIGGQFYDGFILFLKNLALIALFILVACRPYVLAQYRQN